MVEANAILAVIKQASAQEHRFHGNLLPSEPMKPRQGVTATFANMF